MATNPTKSTARASRPRKSKGGETHQVADDVVLTTQQGIPVADDQNTLRAGERGPALLEDFHFREKIFHFDHERIPERVVHARGFGAHGYFETYEPLTDLTRADLFQRAGERTPAFVRFSTVAGSQGSMDLARDVRGFAVKLYTQEGNWDIVGNNIPVFFIQDPIKFPDVIHSVKAEPDRGFPQAQSAHDNFWDFVSLMPESTHMLMWVMSDRAIPRSFRFMEGFGVHTFRLINAGRPVDLREVPLEAEAGHAVGVVGRSGEDQRRRPGLPPARPVGGHRAGRLPGVGARHPGLRRPLRRPVRLRRARPHQAHPRGAAPRAADRPVGARPHRRQLLRRDRAGRVLHRERGSGSGLHQRSAAAGAQLLLPGHPDQAARGPQLHPHPGERAEVSHGPLPAGRAHGGGEPGRSDQLRTELAHRSRAGSPRGSRPVASRPSRR